MRKFLLITVLAGTALPVVPAFADPPGWAPAHGRRAHEEAERARYDERGRYVEPRPLARDARIWKGSDGHYHCRRDNGTTGLVVGAAVGAIVGNKVAGDGDKTIGTIIGAAGGALLGREIDRGDLKCQ